MERIACALVARFELAVRARAEPDLWRRPVAMADLSGPGRLGAVSPAAERLGVRPGLLTASARARWPELDVLAPDAGAMAAAEEEILRALGGLSPRLDSDRRGAFFLGLSGLDRIAPSEPDFAARARAALAARGLVARVAIADQAFTAWVAARRAWRRPGGAATRPVDAASRGDARPGSPAPADRGVVIVPRGRDRQVLSSVGLADLGLSSQAHELLSLLGMTSAAELAALPPGALSRRLGAEGIRLERILGGGGRPFAWPREEMVPGEPERAALELDEPVDDLEPLLFLGKSVVDRVLAQVAASRQVVAELRVVARLDDRSEVAHALRPAEPTLESRAILDLFRLWLESRPFASPVLGLEVIASGARPASARQLSLYHQREEKEAEALARAVARLAAAFGASSVVRPVLADRFRPEARVAWVGFDPEGSPSPPPSPRPKKQPRGWVTAKREAEAAERERSEPGLSCQVLAPPLSSPRPSIQALPAGPPKGPYPAPAQDPTGASPARRRARRASPGVPSPGAGSPGSPSPIAPAPTAPSPGTTPPVLRIGEPEPVEWRGGLLRRPGRAAARIVASEGPVHLAGEWWVEGGFDRSYHWLTLADGSLCWVYQDHRDGRCYLHGVAD